jgi:hypothetical protein
MLPWGGEEVWKGGGWTINWGQRHMCTDTWRGGKLHIWLSFTLGFDVRTPGCFTLLYLFLLPFPPLHLYLCYTLLCVRVVSVPPLLLPPHLSWYSINPQLYSWVLSPADRCSSSSHMNSSPLCLPLPHLDFPLSLPPALFPAGESLPTALCVS